MNTNLAEVQTPSKPFLPDAESHPAAESQSDQSPRSSGQISLEFQQLLADLANLHLSEVAKASAPSKPVEECAELWVTAEASQSSRSNKRRHSPEQSPTSSARLVNFHNVAKRRLSVSSPCVDAQQILSAWSDDPVLSLFSGQSTDLTKMSHKETKIPIFQTRYQFDLFLVFILLLDMIGLALDLQLEGIEVENHHSTLSVAHGFFTGVDVLASVVFLLDLAGHVATTFSWKFWTFGGYVDVFVGLSSAAQLAIWLSGANRRLLRIAQLGKLPKGLRLLHLMSNMPSLHLLNKCLMASRFMLFWSFLLLSLFHMAGGLIVSALVHEFIQEKGYTEVLRREVWVYYGTFTRTFCTMFEVLFANWGPPCRILVELTPWFWIFFLIWRCIFGFAILNVLNAVFVSQTLKTASNDEDLAYKQRQQEMENYQKKVSLLFQKIDSSGDGVISREEFAKLVESPMLQFWMSQLELEYHDMLGLFEFLDQGDGQITLQSLTEGSKRLRGGAKALDIWRLETKLEILSSEILAQVGDGVTPLEPIFRKSGFRSLKSHGATSTKSRSGEFEISNLGTGARFTESSTNTV